MREILRYATRGGAIERQYISGVGINPNTAFEEMLSAKRIFHQEKGKQYLHLVVSCDQIMQRPSNMHEIGEAIARFYKDYQVLITTHTDTDNLHCHLVVNSVNMKTGNKLSQRRRDFWRFLKFTDNIFKRYGLPPIGFEQLYQVVFNEEFDFWDDDDYENFDDIIHGELEELQSKCGVRRALYFMDEAQERQDVLCSIERLKTELEGR